MAWICSDQCLLIEHSFIHLVFSLSAFSTSSSNAILNSFSSTLARYHNLSNYLFWDLNFYDSILRYFTSQCKTLIYCSFAITVFSVNKRLSCSCLHCNYHYSIRLSYQKLFFVSSCSSTFNYVFTSHILQYYYSKCQFLAYFSVTLKKDQFLNYYSSLSNLLLLSDNPQSRSSCSTLSYLNHFSLSLSWPFKQLTQQAQSAIWATNVSTKSFTSAFTLLSSLASILLESLPQTIYTLRRCSLLSICKLTQLSQFSKLFYLLWLL